MPHLPPNVEVLPVDLVEVPQDKGGQLSEDSTLIVPIKTRNQTISIVQREHPERVAEESDLLQVTVNTDGFQDPLERNSPVTRVPSEVLAYIFELYVVRLGELTFDGVHVHGPFRLTQVCKLWKAVAESDPHLWTSIHFYFSESHTNRMEDVPRTGPVFDQHLKRSGALPISLSFTDHRTYQPVTHELVALLLDQLRAHARRWRRISIHLSGAYFPLLFPFMPDDLDNLEYLHITCDVFPQSGPLHLNFESATNLKSFSYSGPGPSADDRIQLHWESLEDVSFEFTPHYGSGYTLSRQFRHLAQCQNITTCSLGIDRTRPHHIGTQTITLSRLQTLRVRRLSPLAHVRGPIDLLILPQLQTLEIDASVLVGWNERWHDRNFSGLLTRSKCTLLHLSIRDVDFPNDELVRCLALSPALTSLRFVPCPRSQDINNVIRKLDILRTPTNANRTQGHGQRQVAHSGPLVPRLRNITLASSVEGYLDPILTMFRSRVGPSARAAGVSPLQRSNVIFFDMWHDMGVDRVRSPEDRLESVAKFRADLAQWVSENRKKDRREDEDGLEASVVVNSPYLPEYINVV